MNSDDIVIPEAVNEIVYNSRVYSIDISSPFVVDFEKNKLSSFAAQQRVTGINGNTLSYYKSYKFYIDDDSFIIFPDITSLIVKESSSNSGRRDGINNKIDVIWSFSYWRYNSSFNTARLKFRISFISDNQDQDDDVFYPNYDSNTFTYTVTYSLKAVKVEAVFLEKACPSNINCYDANAVYGNYLIKDYVLCVPKKPKVSDFNCVSCLLRNDEYIAYRNRTIFEFTLTDFGESELCDQPKDISLSFYGFEGMNINNDNLGKNTFTVLIDDSLDSTNNNKLSLTITGYQSSNNDITFVPATTDLSKFRFCFVPELTSNPIIDQETTYFSKENSFVFNFIGVEDLYSDCFAQNASYSIYYWFEDNDQTNSTIQLLHTELAKKDSLQVETSPIANTLEPGLYYYHIVASNVVGESTKSDDKIFIVCSSQSDWKAPDLIFPANGDTNITIINTQFKWSVTSATLTMCCNGSTATLKVELDSEDEYDPKEGPNTSIERISFPSKTSQNNRLYISPQAQALSLSTRYYWRVTIEHKNSVGTKSIFFSKINSFLTAPKHCSYIDCHHGICNPSTFRCECFSDYYGDFCEESGLRKEIYIVIFTLFSVFFLIVVTIIVIFLKRKYFIGLRIPDFNRFLFTLPKPITEDDDDSSLSSEFLLSLLNEDCDSQAFTMAINLLEYTPVTALDSVCKSFFYCFERQKNGLNFLKRLIKYEVEKSEDTTTLFRNNSFASKCFKAYCRMIGLPYLFRVVFPLINKLYKEAQKETIVVSGIDSVTVERSNNEYELKNTDTENEDNIAYDAEIEQNALTIQVACEAFFDALNSSFNYCPHEFKEICQTIEREVHSKYPGHPIESCLAAFIFLRFFVAGITVPESFGIIDKGPDPLIRRRLIIISKVISNMSTQVKFGDKEEYMIVMNDYLESKQQLLEKYYSFLCSSDSKKNSPSIDIPDKYYNASLEILSQAFAYQNQGEWTKEDAC